MKKYLYAFKFEVMTTLQYAFNFIGKMFSLFLMIFVFMNLWNFMYDDPSQAINGYTKFQMIWYVSISELIYFITRGRQTCEEISRHIKNGNIAYTINKPYDYVVYTLFTLLGRSFVSSAFYTAFIMIIHRIITSIDKHRITWSNFSFCISYHNIIVVSHSHRTIFVYI